MYTSAIQQQTVKSPSNSSLTSANKDQVGERDRHVEEGMNRNSLLRRSGRGTNGEGDSNYNGNHSINNLSILPNHINLIQPKLKINKPGDKYEKEADQVAEQVLRMETPTIQRKCTKCDEEETIQTKSNNPSLDSASPTLANQINSSKGMGQPMDSNTRTFMESRFNMDFSKVKIHSDSRSSELSNQINAQAFTIGKDIYFNSGKYQTSTLKGKKLLAHELTHVVQQSKNSDLGIQREPIELNYEALAKQIDEATGGIFGWGTDEEAIYNALSQLEFDLEAVKKLEETYERLFFQNA